jgi:hypothetical protein
MTEKKRPKTPLHEAADALNWEHGITYRELARRAGVQRSSIRRWIEAAYPPDHAYVTMAKGYGITAGSLIETAAKFNKGVKNES